MGQREKGTPVETETKTRPGLCPCKSSNCSDAASKPVESSVQTPTGLVVRSFGPGTMLSVESRRVRVYLTDADLQALVNYAHDHHNVVAQLWTDGQ